jgi:hypothetical protein
MTEVKKEAGPAQHKIPVKHAGSLILPEIHAARKLSFTKTFLDTGFQPATGRCKRGVASPFH